MASEAPADEPARAEAYALDLLARRQRSVYEVRQRLTARGYSEGVVEQLLERMLRIGYLNDRQFARTWVEVRGFGRPCGPALLRQELRLKGIDPALIAEVLAEAMGHEVETGLAVEAARKRLRGTMNIGRAGEPADPSDVRKARERLWGFLRRRGFSGAACEAGLDSAFGRELDSLED